MGFGLVSSSCNLIRISTLALISLSSPRSIYRIAAPQLRASSSKVRISNLSLFSITGSRRRGVGALDMSAQARGDGTGSSLVEFALSPHSALKIQKGDITEWSVDGSSDAIVNPANERMLGGGGADGEPVLYSAYDNFGKIPLNFNRNGAAHVTVLTALAIHNAAGPELREACYKVPEVQPGVRCPTGEARITPGFRLPAAYVIHTVGPIYDIHPNPEASLKNSYRNSLQVAKENKVQYIAFPAISCGVFRYPIDEAAKTAISTVKDFGAELKEVHFVLFSDEIYNAWVNSAHKILNCFNL